MVYLENPEVDRIFGKQGVEDVLKALGNEQVSVLTIDNASHLSVMSHPSIATDILRHFQAIA